jgi:hypothetical protein
LTVLFRSIYKTSFLSLFAMLTDRLPRTSEDRQTPPRKPFSYQLLPDGRWVESVGAERYTRESPAHAVLVASYPTGNAADVHFTERLIGTGKEHYTGTRQADLDSDSDIFCFGWDQHHFLHVWLKD